MSALFVLAACGQVAPTAPMGASCVSAVPGATVLDGCYGYRDCGDGRLQLCTCEDGALGGSGADEIAMNCTACADVDAGEQVATSGLPPQGTYCSGGDRTGSTGGGQSCEDPYTGDRVVDGGYALDYRSDNSLWECLCSDGELGECLPADTGNAFAEGASVPGYSRTTYGIECDEDEGGCQLRDTRTAAVMFVIGGVALTATEVALIYAAAVGLGYVAYTQDLGTQIARLLRLTPSQLGQAFQRAHGGATLAPPPRRPTPMARPTPSPSRIPDRRAVDPDGDGFVTIYRAPRYDGSGTRGTADACNEAPWGRFWAPPAYRDVAEDYARSSDAAASSARSTSRSTSISPRWRLTSTASTGRAPRSSSRAEPTSKRSWVASGNAW